MAEQDNTNRNIWIGIIVVVALIAGLWKWLDSDQSMYTGVDSARCYTAQEARNHVGTHGCVDFTVGYTYESNAGNKFLDEYEDYQKGFAVYIPTGSSASDIVLSDYDGKNISVTGDITLYKGALQIEVKDTSQISGN